jgi:hypothetical protein
MAHKRKQTLTQDLGVIYDGKIPPPIIRVIVGYFGDDVYVQDFASKIDGNCG